MKKGCYCSNRTNPNEAFQTLSLSWGPILARICPRSFSLSFKFFALSLMKNFGIGISTSFCNRHIHKFAENTQILKTQSSFHFKNLLFRLIFHYMLIILIELFGLTQLRSSDILKTNDHSTIPPKKALKTNFIVIKISDTSFE